MSSSEPKILQIDVTEEDIKAGRKNNCFLCPVALAVKRALGLSSDSIDVTATYSYITYCPYRRNQKIDDVLINQTAYNVTPEPAQNFINRFDAGQNVVPFSFNIELSKKLGAIERSKP